MSCSLPWTRAWHGRDVLEAVNFAGGSVALEVDDLDALTAPSKSGGIHVRAKHIRSPVCRVKMILDSEGDSLILHQFKRG